MITFALILTYHENVMCENGIYKTSKRLMYECMIVCK